MLGKPKRDLLGALALVHEERAQAAHPRQRHLLVLHLEDHALDAAREPDARDGSAAKLLGQAVVAPAAADRALGSHYWRPDFPHRSGVVVQPAHQTWVDRIRDARGFDVAEPRLEVGAALGTQVVCTLRCALENGLAFGSFLVEQTQRVRFQPPLAL